MREFIQLVKQYDLPSALNTPKGVWKRLVKAAIAEGSKAKLLDQVHIKYKKLDHDALKNEKFETKDYLKVLRLSDARLKGVVSCFFSCRIMKIPEPGIA